MSRSDALTPVPSRRRQGIKNGELAVPGGPAAEADQLAQHIRRVVDSAPPLTPAQRDRLAVLLQSSRTSS